MARKDYNRKGKFEVVKSYDGCNFESLTYEIPSLATTRRAIKELVKMGYDINTLDIRDLETGRLISWTL